MACFTVFLNDIKNKGKEINAGVFRRDVANSLQKSTCLRNQKNKQKPQVPVVSIKGFDQVSQN